jgi:hypothetical protein
MRSLTTFAAVLAVAAGAAALSAPAFAQTIAQAVKNDAPPKNPKDISGIWFMTGGGKFPPYPWTPAFGAIAKKRADDMERGNPYQPAGASCLPRGLVGMLTTGAYPLEIFQTPKEVAVIKENGGVHRIYLNRQHLTEDDLTPLFFGDAVGKWEGNSLVVDTISLGATDNIDGQNPHSDVMHVIEKFTRTGEKTLQVEVTVDDKKAFTKPITTTAYYTARPDYEIQEYYCVNDRNVTDNSGAQVIAGSR